MYKSITERLAVLLTLGCLSIASHTATAERVSQTPVDVAKRNVDLVIALDVSGSMSGLIESAKQRLWDIVNELGRAEPKPVLRVAILSFGNPVYGRSSGYVRINQAFTQDLDAVNETLFGLTTNGGNEYVARAVQRALRQLQWSSEQDALRTVFVAGNESAYQDPAVTLADVTRLAKDMDVSINTIFCGSEHDQVASGWKQVAQTANGMYASIDQNVAAVAAIEAPQDAELSRLNQRLNATFMAYGAMGKARQKNVQTQDANAQSLGAAAAASRTVTKAGSLYDTKNWDVVGAAKAGISVETMTESELPESMRDMDADGRVRFVEELAAERDEVKSEIMKLAKEREDFLDQQRALSPKPAAQGLDDVLQEGLRGLAEKKGFVFH